MQTRFMDKSTLLAWETFDSFSELVEANAERTQPWVNERKDAIVVKPRFGLLMGR